MSMQFKLKQYYYVGPDDIREHAKNEPPGEPITSQKSLMTWIQNNNDDIDGDGLIKATFTISSDFELVVACRNREHVACASAEPVLSAGEIGFDPDDVTVEYISNQSSGYCPELRSWIAVEIALNKANLKHPGSFTHEFEWRKCENNDCGQIININVDDISECLELDCRERLPDVWNCWEYSYFEKCEDIDFLRIMIPFRYDSYLDNYKEKLLSVYRSIISSSLLINDTDVTAYAIISMASLQSKELIPELIEIFEKVDRPLVHQRILQYFCHVPDLSIIPFLEEYLSNEDSAFRDIAEDALKKCRNIEK